MSKIDQLDIIFLSDYDDLRREELLSQIDLLTFESQTIVTTAHNPSVLDVLHNVYEYQSDIAIVYKKGKLIGYLPFCITLGLKAKLVSLPHFSYGGFVGVCKLNDSESDHLFIELEKKYQMNILVRDLRKLTTNTNTEKVSYFLKLVDSPETQFIGFSSKLRSQIRKAKKNGLVVEHSTVEEFYEIYLENMHRLGSPHLCKSFFAELIENYSNGSAEIFTVKHQGKSIGSGILLTYKDFSEITWAATYSEYNHLATNMILYWKMIEYSIELNMKIFSFGRASKNSGSENFKKQWGGERVQLFWNTNNESRLSIEKFRFLSTIWSYLPRFLIEYFGPIFTKFVY